MTSGRLFAVVLPKKLSLSTLRYGAYTPS